MGGISLTVHAASAPLYFGPTDAPPPVGTSYVRLDLTLANQTSEVAIPENFALFSVTTDQAIVLMASGTSVTHPCLATQSLAAGGNASCGVWFEVPIGQQPSVVTYDDRLGQSATFPVPSLAPTSTCEAIRAWSMAGTSTCVDCVGAVGSGCATEHEATGVACNGMNCTQQCAAQQLDVQGRCECEAMCETGACLTAANAEMDCLSTKCTSSCM